jgi:hypothetical protein
MKIYFRTFLTIGIIVTGCNGKQKQDAFEAEVENWKKELLESRDIGNPCYSFEKMGEEAFEKWANENPEVDFGFSEIKSRKFDFNDDEMKDGLFYFTPENCVGGNIFRSDLAMFVYSKNGKYITDKTVTSKIERIITSELEKIDTAGIQKLKVSYKSLGKTIVGEYFGWASMDPNCCSSLNGRFEYDPIKLTIKMIDK